MKYQRDEFRGKGDGKRGRGIEREEEGWKERKRDGKRGREMEREEEGWKERKRGEGRLKIWVHDFKSLV